MKPFLGEVANAIFEKYRVFDRLTIVFPNRRAVLYFRKHLSALLSKPAFAPRLITIEDHFLNVSDLIVPDKLDLIHRLYLVYNTIVYHHESKNVEPEPFHQFYFWGEMLLRDFDEADKYLIDTSQLFKDLSHQKELDAAFDYLTEEQREFLANFWSSFSENTTENKKKFLTVWNKLHLLYETFKEELLKEGLAFDGMLQRNVAERIEDILKDNANTNAIAFVGFNALTKAEEKIISYYVQQGLAEIYWDLDEYYINNNAQEAGKFFREYQNHPVLGKTFPKDIPSNLVSGLLNPSNVTASARSKSVRIFGAAQPIGQAKLMAQILKEELEKGMDPEDTLIVLPDENLLLPVLHSVSGYVEKMNVTMGFPIGATPVFNLVEMLVEMQINRKGIHFNHRHVLALLGHPYLIAADPGIANAKRREILSRNWVHIPMGYLASESHLHRVVFQQIDDNVLSYLRIILTAIGNLQSITDFDREYFLHFIKLLNRIEEIMGDSYHVEKIVPTKNLNSDVFDKQVSKELSISLKAFLRLFKQLVQTQKIPFSGEPLKGLQIMGVLETRNLDFKNVFILSLNEGSFPSFATKSSYIPFSIRKAYGLPTVEYQDAMYAYFFYRMIQRSENLFLFYNTETDVLGQGESSRYLKQLIFESGLKIERKVLHDPVQPNLVNPIVIQKGPGVIDALVKLSEGNIRFKGISPSALNSYIECRLRFYLRHIAKVKEPDEVEDDLDARVLGNFLHSVMELFYRRVQERKKSSQIDVEDFHSADTVIDRLIDEVFIEAYQLQPGKPVVYEGQRLVVREVVKRFAHRILEMDKAYAPFNIEVLEQGGLAYAVSIHHYPGTTVISGKIDRIDRKDDLIRVIDYKTGKDKLDFESVPSLFNRDAKRNKAAFQTLLYALLYKTSAPHATHKIVPGLINRMNLFDKEFKFGFKVGKNFVEDVDPLLPEFDRHLRLLLDELYNPDVPFDQTTDVELCRYCPYQTICYR